MRCFRVAPLGVIDNGTAGLTKDSFLWNDLPSPLPFLSSATYELQILRQLPLEDLTLGAVITSSALFSISPKNDEDGGDDRGWPTVCMPKYPANVHLRPWLR